MSSVLQPAAAQLIRGFSSTAHARRGEIFALYVAAEHIGLGAGKGLLKAMLARFAERGCANAFAWMLKGNPSRFFYERMGAKLVAEKAERRFGTVIDLQAYAWPDLARFSAPA